MGGSFGHECFYKPLVELAGRRENLAVLGQETALLSRIIIEVHKMSSLISLCFMKAYRPHPPRWVTWHEARENIAVLNVDESCLGASGRIGFKGLMSGG